MLEFALICDKPLKIFVCQQFLKEISCKKTSKFFAKLLLEANSVCIVQNNVYFFGLMEREQYMGNEATTT